MPAKQKHQPLPQHNPQPDLSHASSVSSTQASATSDSAVKMPPEGSHSISPDPADMADAVPQVNRKKQKRRMKEAAKREAAQEAATTSPLSDSGFILGDKYGGEAPRRNFSDGHTNGHTNQRSASNGYSLSLENNTGGQQQRRPSTHERSRKGRPASPPATTAPKFDRGQLWSTTAPQERERIKAFWLSLGEEERRSLVKVEKDAVLKKMKEQQKHTCSCNVCGRKRIAIEEELEVLYDAYYDELEQYAHKQGPGIPPTAAASQRFGQMSGLQPPDQLPQDYGTRRQREETYESPEHEVPEGSQDDDEEYSEADFEDEEYSDEDIPPLSPPDRRADDFFNFGASLTVKGGILTVADDLLKNDGKKFIEMMEQLAERRMAREEDAKHGFIPRHPPPRNPPAHHHAPPVNNGHAPLPEDEEEYDDDEEDDEDGDYDSEGGDYGDEEDEEELVRDYDQPQNPAFETDDYQDTMTETQRMEEGRRMFQIFAARMFEQRVLAAYKVKVAEERQKQLLTEEEEETRLEEERKLKKAQDAAKKKEKARLKKQAVAEEKARKEAEKAAELAALQQAEAQKLEEQRQKAEEKRRKKEAQKKAEEEEKARKEAEKLRRLQETRERQAEQERKAREAKDRERKEREEVRQKEKEAREAKERDIRERKAKQEHEKREAENKTKASQRQMKPVQPMPAIPVQIVKRPQPAQAPARIPAGVQNAIQPAPSPRISVATPIIPKAPTPQRQLSASQNDSASLPRTPVVTTHSSSNTSPSPATPLRKSSPTPAGPANLVRSQMHQMQNTTLLPHSARQALSSTQNGNGPSLGQIGYSHGPPGQLYNGAPQQSEHMPQYAGMYNNHYGQVGQSNGLPPFSSMNHRPVPIPQGRGFPAQHPPPGLHQATSGGFQPMTGFSTSPIANPHSRQQSASFDHSSLNITPPVAPVSKPAPIGRPPSTQGYRNATRRSSHSHDVEDVTRHLGSSALLDDAEPLTGTGNYRRASAAPGHFAGRQNYVQPSPFGDSSFSNGWNSSTPPTNNPFGTSSLPGHEFMNGWSAQPGSFNAQIGGSLRQPQNRAAMVRQFLVAACRQLDEQSPNGSTYHPLALVKQQVDRLSRDEPVSESALLDLCETEGNSHNGGGHFDTRDGLGIDGRIFIRYMPDGGNHYSGTIGPVGALNAMKIGGGNRAIGPPGDASIMGSVTKMGSAIGAANAQRPFQYVPEPAPIGSRYAR